MVLLKVPGVAEEMAGRHAGGIGHGEGREQRMWVGEIDALVAHRRHGRRGFRCHRQGAQAVRHEQDQIVRRLRGGRRNLPSIAAAQADSEQALPERHGGSPLILCCDVALDTPPQDSIVTDAGYPQPFPPGMARAFNGSMFKRILIANRGEIACRIIKTARRMGIETVAVYSEADKDALHVEMADTAVAIGPPPAAESYLVIDKIVAACKAERRRGRASRLRLPVRARGLSQGAGRGRHRLHRAEPEGHRRHGRQDRVQEGGGGRQGLDRARPSRRDRERRRGGEDRRARSAIR